MALRVPDHDLARSQHIPLVGLWDVTGTPESVTMKFICVTTKSPRPPAQWGFKKTSPIYQSIGDYPSCWVKFWRASWRQTVTATVWRSRRAISTSTFRQEVAEHAQIMVRASTDVPEIEQNDHAIDDFSDPHSPSMGSLSNVNRPIATGCTLTRALSPRQVTSA